MFSVKISTTPLRNMQGYLSEIHVHFSFPFLVDHKNGKYISVTILDPFHLTPHW